MLTRVANSSMVSALMHYAVVLLAMTTVVFAIAVVAAFAHLAWKSHRYTFTSATVFVPRPAPAAATADRASIVDIASNVTDVLPLITLGQGEHVIAVDDQPVENDLVAGTLIQRYRRGQFSFVDVTTNQRRILVLQH
jgi:hypothetical protein